MRKVVVIGGGTGTYTVLKGLREYNFELSAIVSTADDGGSTGILRDELGVLPPGDIRQALAALSPDASIMRELLSYRFDEGSLKGHSFGNLFLSALEKVTGSFDQAVIEASRILAVDGQVLPVTTDTISLRARTDTGQEIRGEHAIEDHIWAERSHLQELWLEPKSTLHPQAALAIKQADLLVIAPGSIFTSLIPNLLVGGMQEALQGAKAPLIYVVNLMTERGQTGTFSVQDFVDLVQQYLGQRIPDYVIYNTKAPDKSLLERYKREMERSPVRLDSKRLHTEGYKLIGANLLTRKGPKVSSNDALAATRTYIRHDPAKLADVLSAILAMKQAERFLKTITYA